MSHHKTDDSKSAEELAQNLFAHILRSSEALEEGERIAKKLVAALRANDISLVVLQQGHLTKTLEAMESLQIQLRDLQKEMGVSDT